MDKNVTEMDAGNNDGGEYKVEAIRDSTVYAQESKSSHLPDLYYLILWKRYSGEKNIWESSLAI